MLIVNIATLVEGFITDLILSEIEANPNASKLTFEELGSLTTTAGWTSKVRFFYKVFSLRIEDIDSSKAIDNLFRLRNNIAHGRSFTEVVIYKGEKNHEKVIENTNYQNVIKYLTSVGKYENRPDTIKSSVFWDLNVVCYFHLKSHEFLFKILNTVSFVQKAEFEKLLKEAYKF